MAKTELMIVGDTAADRIFDAWKKNAIDKLDDDDKEILKRITEVEKRFHEKKLVKDNDGNDTKFGRPWKWKELVEWLVASFDISVRQAYADIEMAKDFFLIGRGRNDIEFARGYRVMQGEELMYQAMDNGNEKAAAAFFKEIVQLDVHGRKDDGGMDAAMFQPIKPIIVSDPSELGFPKLDKPDQVVERLKQGFKKGIVEKMLDDAEDVEPEEL